MTCFFEGKCGTDGDEYVGRYGTSECSRVEVKCDDCGAMICSNHNAQAPPAIHAPLDHLAAEDQPSGELFPMYVSNCARCMTFNPEDGSTHEDHIREGANDVTPTT